MRLDLEALGEYQLIGRGGRIHVARSEWDGKVQQSWNIRATLTVKRFGGIYQMVHTIHR